MNELCENCYHIFYFFLTIRIIIKVIRKLLCFTLNTSNFPSSARVQWTQVLEWTPSTQVQRKTIVVSIFFKSKCKIFYIFFVDKEIFLHPKYTIIKTGHEFVMKLWTVFTNTLLFARSFYFRNIDPDLGGT